MRTGEDVELTQAVTDAALWPGFRPPAGSDFQVSLGKVAFMWFVIFESSVYKYEKESLKLSRLLPVVRGMQIVVPQPKTDQMQQVLKAGETSALVILYVACCGLHDASDILYG